MEPNESREPADMGAHEVVPAELIEVFEINAWREAVGEPPLDPSDG